MPPRKEFPRNSSVSGSDPLPFCDMFRHVLVARFGKPGDKVTASGRVAEAFRTTMTTFVRDGDYKGAPVPNGKTLENWCAGGDVPYDKRFEPVLACLFAKDPEHTDHTRLKAAWEAADAERTIRINNRRGTGSLGLDEPDPTSSDFDTDNDPPLQTGLAELRIDPPPRGGNAPTMVPIHVSLSFDEFPDMVENHGVTLALTEAALVPSYAAGCQPDRNSRAGESDNPKGGLETRAGQWIVSGPKNQAGHLIGEPLDENQKLLNLRVTGADTDGVTLTLRSKPKSLVVIPDDPEDEARITKDKMLQLLLQRCQDKDKDGWIVWGRSRLRRKKPAP